MALTPLPESYDRSSSGFQAKLSAIVGIGQSIKQSQVAKQQMRQQFEMQRQLIGERAEARFETQRRLEQEVRQPAEQAENFQKTVLEADEKATANYKSLVEEYNSSEFDTVRKYNLMPAYFRKEADPETGLPQVKIYTKSGDDIIDLSWQQYEGALNEARSQAEWFDKLEEGLEKGWFPEKYPEGEQTRTTSDGRVVQRLTQDKANDILQAAQKDPTFAREALQDSMTRFETPAPYEAPETEGGDGLPSKNVDTIHEYFNVLKGQADSNGVLTFSFTDNPSWFRQLGVSLGLAEMPESVAQSINLGSGTQTVSQIKEKLNSISTNLFNVDLTALERVKNSDVRNQILAGDDTGLDGDLEDLAQTIGELRGDEVASDEIDKVFKVYFNLDNAKSEWLEKFSQTDQAVGDNRLLLNWNAQNPAQAFEPIGAGDSAQRIFNQRAAQNLRQTLSTQ